MLKHTIVVLAGEIPLYPPRKKDLRGFRLRQWEGNRAASKSTMSLAPSWLVKSEES